MANAAKSTATKKTVKKATTKSKSASAESAKATTKSTKPAAAAKKSPMKDSPTKKSSAKKSPEKPATTATAKSTTKSPAKPAGKSSAKKPAPAPSIAMPMIDTNLAAESAAKMLLNRPSEPVDVPAQAAQPAKESSTFKSLKEQLSKPKPSGLGGLFGPTGSDKKFGNQGFTGPQKGHNQTFGGLNKTGVPRRTNG